jgi:hypothetical protein
MHRREHTFEPYVLRAGAAPCHRQAWPRLSEALTIFCVRLSQTEYPPVPGCFEAHSLRVEEFPEANDLFCLRYMRE